MNLNFPEINIINYHSSSQRIRVISESWLQNEMYCPSCCCEHITKLPNNMKLADFQCDECGEIYELKSKKNYIGSSILDGAYYTALERITSNANPNLFVLSYHENLVNNLVVVPKYFFTPEILRIRNPLSQTAKRAGYIGSTIIYSEIPSAGKIQVIESHREIAKESVMINYAHAVRLKVENINLRGWLMDIMKCVDKITHEIFSIDDIYSFSEELRIKHPDNHNISAKIRQQLQFLRNKGFIEFLGSGKYRKIVRNL